MEVNTNKEPINVFDQNGNCLKIGDAVVYEQNLASKPMRVEGIIRDIIPTVIVGGIGYKIDIRATSIRSDKLMRAWSNQVVKYEPKRGML